MQDYFLKSRLSQRADVLGGVVLRCILCILFFLFLWGVRLPALTAGFGLFACIEVLKNRGKEERLRRKEAMLRRKIGGEMALERLLVGDLTEAHMEVARHLSLRYGFEILSASADGVLCKSDQETLLITYLPFHEKDVVTATCIAHFQRAVKIHQADRMILCTGASLSENASYQAALSPVVTLFGKDTLVAMLGRAHPATDRELAALSKRHKSRFQSGKGWRMLFSPALTNRYLKFAGLMTALHFISHQIAYAVSGILLMVLAVICRICQLTKEK